jgi:hypothetical protein
MDLREHVLKASIAVSVLATAYLLSGNIFLSFIVASSVAILLLSWDSRVFIGIGLIFLIFCPFLLAFEKKVLAEEMAVYAYYMLALGVFLQIVQYFKDSIFSKNKDKITKKTKSMKSWSKKKILSFALGTGLLVLIVFAGCFSFIYLKIGEKFGENEKLMASIITVLSENEKQTAEKIAENQQEPTGEDFNTKNVDWENVKVLVENTTEQEGLEVKIADKFKKLGCLNVYTTKTSGVLYQDTLVQYCAGCSDIALELLSVLHDSEGLLIREESGLSNEIIIKLGADQIIIANSEITISILNGSNVIGVARKLKDEMAGQGFNIIKVGDADKKDYQKTIIRYSLNNFEKADIVKDYLSAPYDNLEMLEDSGLTTDIEIILGAINDQETSI